VAYFFLHHSSDSNNTFAVPKGLDSLARMGSLLEQQPSEKRISVAIVGGGLGGVALAIGLIKQGVHVQIYEAAQRFGEIGAGVIFGPNSARAMGLIEPKILEGFKRCATTNTSEERVHTWLSFRYGMDSRNGNGKKCGDLIAHLDDEKQVNSWTGTKTRTGVHRAKFLEEMVKLVPKGTAIFQKTLKDLETVSNGERDEVKLTFADGTTATADCVIGCDGIKSRVREILYGDKAQPKYAGEYGYRALVPRDVATEVLGTELAENGQMYCGYGGYIITYPVEHHALINMVAVRRKPWTSTTQWLIPSEKEDMIQDFEGWDPTLIELISRFENRDKWGMFDLNHDEKYYRGRICLAGDSAHASTPNLGAGAGMAMEDAYILSNLLATAQDPMQIEDAFRAYDAIRRPRTQKCVTLSRLAGIANEFEADGILDDFDKLQADIDDRYRWVWDEDLEAQLKKAKKLMTGH
jgi:salicylate hydroxylase